MSSERFNDVWSTMKNYQLEFDEKSHNDILCTICKKVLINAHNGPCGCRYCLVCITNYLNGETKICPGNTMDCLNELLNMNTNIHIDQPMNRNIIKIQVKCPENNCEFKDKLRNIEDHIRICNFRSINCPYFGIGCKEFNIISNDLKEHMSKEIVSHTKLMLECIDQLKNEIKLLKEDKLQLNTNNENLKDEIKSAKIEITRNEKLINDFKTNFQTVNQELKELKKQFKDQETMLMEKQKETIAQNDELIQRNSRFEMMLAERDNSLSVLEKKLKDLEICQHQQLGGEFVWSIEKWTEKVNDAKAITKTKIFSEAFYVHRNGYKMCLSAYPNGNGDSIGTHLSVFFNLMKGEFDDILPWPFQHDVTFELINQKTAQVHTSYTEKFDHYPNNSAYNKPINERNNGMGSPDFVLLKELSNNPFLCLNDKIFIRCRVKIN